MGSFWQDLYSPNINDTTLDELNHVINHFYLPRRYKNPFGNTTTVTYDSQNFLLIVKLEDPIGNVVTVEGIDYRLLQPSMVIDPNQNRSIATFDVLGMVVGTAVMGKPEPAIPEGDNLDDFNIN